MKQHSRDKDGSAYRLGVDAEEKFKSYMEAKGWIVKPSSLEANTKSHIDFYISKYGWGTLAVDVKSQKKISRSDEAVQQDFVWVEFKNGAGQDGWLYGKADLIAFQDADEFILVSRFALKNMVESKTNKFFVMAPQDAVYNLYRRAGRSDMLTLVKIEDIRAIAMEAVGVEITNG